MPRISIPDFDKIKAGFEPIPENTYTVQVGPVIDKDKSGNELKSSNNNRMLNWPLEVVDNEEFKGRKLFVRTMLEPRESLWNLKALVEACGAKFDATGFDTADLVGARLRVKVAIRPDPKNPDKKYNEVVQYIKL